MGAKWNFPLDCRGPGREVPFHYNRFVTEKYESITLGIEGMSISKDKMAFKSDETPLETLRRIHNFTENKEIFYVTKET